MSKRYSPEDNAVMVNSAKQEQTAPTVHHTTQQDRVQKEFWKWMGKEPPINTGEPNEERMTLRMNHIEALMWWGYMTAILDAASNQLAHWPAMEEDIKKRLKERKR